MTFEEFVDVVCTQIGEYKTKDGLRRIFKLYDKEETGVLRFDQLKEIAKMIGEHMDDDALLELMHSVFINHKTESNEEFTFEDFYMVISKYYNREKVWTNSSSWSSDYINLITQIYPYLSHSVIIFD